jgi:serine/threonine protein kinase
VAINVECSQQNLVNLLKNETTIVNYLHAHGSRNIPNIIWFGTLDRIDTSSYFNLETQHKDYLALIMPLYECSLYEYKNIKIELSYDHVTSIMVQAINILESIHSNFVIHRDIKPDNFMIKKGELFLIDFGFSTFYVNSEKQHITMDCSHQSIIGTPKYVSIFIHDGVRYSRRDDLISLGYILIFLFLGDKSRQNKIQSDMECSHIMHPINQELKKEKSLDNIENLYKSEFPQIYYYLKTCYDMHYYECPDYTFLKEIFLQTTKKMI